METRLSLLCKWLREGYGFLRRRRAHRGNHAVPWHARVPVSCGRALPGGPAATRLSIGLQHPLLFGELRPQLPVPVFSAEDAEGAEHPVSGEQAPKTSANLV